ncbi:KH domain-containing, RNA-binding, signal transduction-associated protein 2-like isoform X1 [Melitaea cinxia]|uniref:KH domain-containing, RNA-binding, signal transduction-associated protein 2-like isoform X1 n=1 Tax=Melitaea cinxia TaxID=113334 RepID=UPI001E273135|nr:KH domain-containing, RNA-binding, signal transduction-associated protein 2-like isoform X1 [Melitaea cinxia]
MADKYDKNGYNSSDFKRNPQDMKEQEQEQDGEDGSKINEKAGEYMRELLSEKIKLNNAKFPISSRLIDSEVAKVQASGRVPAKDFKYVDVYRDKPNKVTVKVLVPVKEHPKVNFVGKLLGPKGNTMKQLQEETMCKMAILGRGSMRDRQKEEELRNSLDPKYAHLSDELHVEISALAPPAEAHARIAYALAEVKKYLIPDTNDMIRQTQMREIMERDTVIPKRPLLEAPGNKSVVYSACTVTKRSFSYQDPVLDTAGAPPPHAVARPAAPRMPPAPMRPVPGKTKVFSILDRARAAMESSYSYEDPYAVSEPPVPRGPPRAAPEPDYYYDRSQERYYDEDSYYKDEGRDFKASARDVGTRRPGPSNPRHYARASPYARPPKPTQKKRSQ